MKSETDKIQIIIDGFNSEQNKVTVLEVECGSGSIFHFPTNALITGIDKSQKKLDSNKLLHEKILGDIQKFNLPLLSFDIIICWDVLQRFDLAKKVIEKIFRAIKKDGIVIISSPNPSSLKGLVTKFTPYWFHVFVYRYIYGRKDAGRNGQAPFKTCMRFSITPKSIKRLALANNFKVEAFESIDAMSIWAGESFKKKSVVLYYFIQTIKSLVNLISFNLLGDSDYIMILRKQ